MNQDDITLLLLSIGAILFLLYFIKHNESESEEYNQHWDNYKKNLDKHYDDTFNSIHIHDEVEES